MVKSTGFMRRFDDLGRIVIPRDVRRQLEIKEGQYAEIFIDDEGRIILEKCADSEGTGA